MGHKMKTSGQQAYIISLEKETDLKVRGYNVFIKLVDVLDKLVNDMTYKEKKIKFERCKFENVMYDEWGIAIQLLKEAAEENGYIVRQICQHTKPVKHVLIISWDFSWGLVE